MDPDPYSLLAIQLNFGEFFAVHGVGMLLIFFLLFGAAIAASTEVAYFSLTKPEIQEFKRENGLIWSLLQKPKKLLATIVVFNSLVSVAIALIGSMEVEKLLEIPLHEGKEWVPVVRFLLEVVLITIILLFFGEISPKVYASKNRLKLVRWLSVPAATLRVVLAPITILLLATTRFLDKRVTSQEKAASFEDIKHAIDLTNDDESPLEEKEILKGIVNFSNTMVKAVMRARVDVLAISTDLNFEEVIDIVNREGYSRMPVYEDNLDSVKGILYVKDLIPLLKANSVRTDWQSLVRPAYFIPETKKIDDLLDEFKSRRLHIAMVVDEFGGTAGLVTLEDIIEEIFGEIVDEFDDEEVVFSKLSDRAYVFDGKMPLNDLLRTVDLSSNTFEEVRGDSDSLAGLILELHGRIPAKDEVIAYDHYQFTIESVAQNRIKRVKFEILEEKVEEKAEQETAG